jgi:hypothetical protein
VKYNDALQGAKWCGREPQFGPQARPRGEILYNFYIEGLASNFDQDLLFKFNFKIQQGYLFDE